MLSDPLFATQTQLQPSLRLPPLLLATAFVALKNYPDYLAANNVNCQESRRYQARRQEIRRR